MRAARLPRPALRAVTALVMLLLVAPASASVVLHDTANNREEARLSRADAQYALSVTACSALDGDAQAHCMAQGKGEWLRAWTEENPDSAGADAELEAARDQPGNRASRTPAQLDSPRGITAARCRPATEGMPR